MIIKIEMRKILIVILFVTVVASYLDDEYECLNEEFENYGCKCGPGYSQPFSPDSASFAACKNGIYSLDCNLNQTRIESINKLDYLIALIEETSSLSEVCWSEFRFANTLKLSSHTFSYLQFRPVQPAADINLSLRNVFEIDSFAFGSIKLRTVDTLHIRLENGGVGIFSSLIFKPRCFGGIKNCKSFEIHNFYQLTKFYLKTSYFEGSEIETLSIENVNDFGGFESDTIITTNLSTTHIKNLAISKCYLKTLSAQTIGNFNGLISVSLTWSGLAQIEPNSFIHCCNRLKYLDLSNNLIHALTADAFVGLDSLEHLVLDNNPLEFLEQQSAEIVFNTFSTSLVKLSLRSTPIQWLLNNSTTTTTMLALKELHLADTNRLDALNLKHLLRNAPSLEYLDLAASNVIKSHVTLNGLVSKLAAIMNGGGNMNLRFVDLSNPWSVYLNDSQFRESFSRHGQCLWRGLLNQVFVKLDANHPCDCTLFYFYRNLINYYFPILNGSNSNEVKYLKINSYDDTDAWSKIVLSQLPKCYAAFWLQTFSFDLIKKFEYQCGYISDAEYYINHNCSTIDEDHDSSSTTKQNYRTTSPLINSSTISSSTKQDADLFIRKEIMYSYTLPIILGVCGVAVLGIVSIILKTRYDYKNKFLKIYEKTISNSTTRREPKELDMIL